jgi:glycosyltransferase involved in cell wall biosynthesis
MRLCIIARADETGLGIQSRNWVRLLNPHKLVVIDSTSFNGNKQHLEWYKGRGGYIINGFIKPNEINAILNNIDALLTFEIPYSYELLRRAKAKGVKVIIQNNWEFTDYLHQPDLPLPDLLVNHSYWHLDEQKDRWPEITEYCATPVFLEDYEDIYIENINRPFEKMRFLHIAGRKTYEDRNGTQDLLVAIKLIPQDVEFELVIKTQSVDIHCDDPRVIIDRDPPEDEKELYRNFDAVIMPRRYGGACLPMNESLAAGLPVIMTDIDPNNKILPETWLVKAEKTTEFMARTMIDVYSADHKHLARRITDFANIDYDDLSECKLSARDIAESEYASDVIKEKWALLLEKIGV